MIDLVIFIISFIINVSSVALKHLKTTGSKWINLVIHIDILFTVFYNIFSKSISKTYFLNSSLGPYCVLILLVVN